MSHELRLEKRPQEVRLYLADGRQIPVVIYMAIDVADAMVSGQAVAEAVREAAPALPCNTDEGEFLCVGTDSIAAVGVRARDTWDEGFFHLRPCQVHLRGGHRFEGFVRHFEGLGDRLSDALRRTDEWIQLESDGDVIWFQIEQLVTAREREPERPVEDTPSPEAPEAAEPVSV